MEPKDKWLVCVECGNTFLWDVGEQMWYRLKKFANEPKRCRKCRDKKRGGGRFQSPQPSPSTP